jgi:hypothetical protein
LLDLSPNEPVYPFPIVKYPKQIFEAIVHANFATFFGRSEGSLDIPLLTRPMTSYPL